MTLQLKAENTDVKVENVRIFGFQKF